MFSLSEALSELKSGDGHRDIERFVTKLSGRLIRVGNWFPLCRPVCHLGCSMSKASESATILGGDESP